ncbi:hypothetical protein PENTCL1PPCAC_21327, partial [Pristionchus entomophagus]
LQMWFAFAFLAFLGVALSLVYQRFVRKKVALRPVLEPTLLLSIEREHEIYLHYGESRSQ